MTVVYEATQNSDLTEGRGQPITIGMFARLEDAVEAVQGRGVMGVGNGDVYEHQIYHSIHEFRSDPKLSNGPFNRRNRTLVYGYHKSEITGSFRYGYVDDRDLPQSDPEYDTYLRLKEKFKDA